MLPLPPGHLTPARPSPAPPLPLFLTGIQDPELLRFVDLECFLWSTVNADLTPLINAGMVFCDRHYGGINYPVGGVGRIPEEMAAGIQERGSFVEYKANVKVRRCGGDGGGGGLGGGGGGEWQGWECKANVKVCCCGGGGWRWGRGLVRWGGGVGSRHGSMR